MKRRSQSKLENEGQGSRLACVSDDEPENTKENMQEMLAERNVKNSFTPSLEMSVLKRNLLRSPLTPLQNVVVNMKQKLEAQLCTTGDSLYEATDRTSPGLAKLRDTPQGSLRRRQALLEQKHRSAQDRLDGLNVGGGVSIWPHMANMRLTLRETCFLALSSTALIFLTALLFTLIHGDLEERLREHESRLQEFRASYKLTTDTNTTFKVSVLQWHTQFTQHMEEIEKSFSVSLADAPLSYQLAVLLYIVGICTLLFYLADNMLAHSKLTPRRIKIWVSLLVVMGTWTLKVLHLLVLAHRLEYVVEAVIHSFSQKLSGLVYLELELKTYHDVLLQWRTCCLPPTTTGTLTVMGLVSIRDIMYYLQYYSLPVATALFTPVIKLFWSLLEVYAFQPN